MFDDEVPRGEPEGAPATPAALRISEDEKRELAEISASQALPAGRAFRARLVLLLAEGQSWAEVRRSLGTSAPTIARWRKRYLEGGLRGLMEERRPGRRPSRSLPELRLRIREAVLRGPGDGSKAWSCRRLARELGVSKDAVHRNWRAAVGDARPSAERAAAGSLASAAGAGMAAD